MVPVSRFHSRQILAGAADRLAGRRACDPSRTRSASPYEFPEAGPCHIGWNWSLTLDGNYSGSFAEPIRLDPFLPAKNREAVLHVARYMEVEAFFEDSGD